MPSVQLVQSSCVAGGSDSNANPLPKLLQTPSGYAIVELQGDIVQENSTASISTAINVGRLVFPSADGQDANDAWDGQRCFLLVGEHQRLKGEVKKMARPLALLQRRSSTETEQVAIADIIRFKILFSQMPEPIVTEQHLQPS